ncbi:DUF4150 domain-containing protein [Corallococcus sp. bb12-1]|uniref:DUF4150 domain-containing protein n=1 Tax=Corallococcus sp. bb12-1 TaxID=2996784 RepID=UPI002270C365|nr:DUF4150 domain-containing protein [Corallococcus sp. bb12-1]MCY1041609.1 DUF4150 domain-containing protein [Corallococcus sp. bb12-1]
MTKVSVNAPKTPVTESSSGVAAATLPNVCKMPGPPAPFVPTPLPNIGKSGTDPKKYSKTVTIDGKKVAIRGSTFGSMGDVASKGTGGGIVSANVEGPTSFVGPGSMDTKIEGKNVQLLGDPMLNNCGPGGSPANAATMMGVIQVSGLVTIVDGKDVCPVCRKTHGALEETPTTTLDAAQLARKLGQKVRTSNSSFPPTMLGVVQCKCGKKQKYADQSGSTHWQLYQSVKELGWGAPARESVIDPATGKPEKSQKNRVRDFLLERHRSQEKVVQNAWARAHVRFDKYTKREASNASYPPGSCAAPKALMLVLQDNAHPGAITERWFHPEKLSTSGEIKYLDAKSGKPNERKFAHGETVPPCGACELIIPLLLCPGDEKKQCQHT